jgi:hypothetical protein
MLWLYQYLLKFWNLAKKVKSIRILTEEFGETTLGLTRLSQELVFIRFARFLRSGDLARVMIITSLTVLGGLAAQFVSDYYLLDILCSNPMVRSYEKKTIFDINPNTDDLHDFYLCHMRTVIKSRSELNKSINNIHIFSRLYPTQVDTYRFPSVLKELHSGLMWIVARGDVAGRTAVLSALVAIYSNFLYPRKKGSEAQ